MTCPTCHKTMYELGCSVKGRPLHWCYYCGTLETCDGNRTVPYIWTLTEFARQREAEQQRTSDGG